MKVLKKNQVVIIVIAVMLITAGYLNYKGGNESNLIETSNIKNPSEIAEIGDAKLVNSNNITEKNEDTVGYKKDIESQIAKAEIVEDDAYEEKDVKNSLQDVKQTSANISSSDNYFASSKLGRDTMYSQMIESYEKILQNQSISSEQKAIAQTEIKKINELKNSIMITENLIKTKGFADVVIFVNDTSVNAIIKADTLKEQETAQIQNILTRELKTDIDNVHISCK